MIGLDAFGWELADSVAKALHVDLAEAIPVAVKRLIAALQAKRPAARPPLTRAAPREQREVEVELTDEQWRTLDAEAKAMQVKTVDLLAHALILLASDFDSPPSATQSWRGSNAASSARRPSH